MPDSLQIDRVGLDTAGYEWEVVWRALVGIISQKEGDLSTDMDSEGVAMDTQGDWYGSTDGDEVGEEVDLAAAMDPRWKWYGSTGVDQSAKESHGKAGANLVPTEFGRAGEGFRPVLKADVDDERLGIL
eukprot:gene30657-35673_t